MNKKIEKFELNAYWDRKLAINHKTEEIRYKKLCGNKLSKKEKKCLGEKYFITYSGWSEYIEEKLSALDDDELLEYGKYINGRLRLQPEATLFSNFAMPVAMFMMTPILENVFDMCIWGNNPAVVSVLILPLWGSCLCVAVFLLMQKMIVKYEREKKISGSFYGAFL